MTSRNKCIQVAAGNGRLQADVIPCLDYKVYRRRYDVVDGIVFYHQRDGRRIVNYPKLHIENGWTKNDAAHTDGRYKPMVRIFKNWRNKVKADGYLRTLAASYFVECLLYNVPDVAFRETTYQKSVLATLRVLHTANLTKFICQNGMLKLCGETPEQWPEQAARAFINTCIKSWNA